jgi:hypothetical protein
MNTHPTDLENSNDNLPLKHRLSVVRKCAEQMGYPVMAATIQCALDELEARRK